MPDALILSRKSTSGGIQFLGDKLVSWMSKKQKCIAMSSAELCSSNVDEDTASRLWLQLQQNTRVRGVICKLCSSNMDEDTASRLWLQLQQNTVVLRLSVENGIIELYFVRTEYQLADMFTKALPEDRFKYLVRRIGMRCLTPAELEVLTNESA
ncbi:hypothetical protein Tco_1341327 [Tanacetum coccineum]